jgi:hypothetical protein
MTFRKRAHDACEHGEREGHSEKNAFEKIDP